MRSPSITPKLTNLFLPAFAAIMFTSCKNEKETIEVETPQAYMMPLQLGKYITYRLDSTVFTNAGRTQEERAYQEKHMIDVSFLDNTGRTSYKVYRFLRDIDGTTPWAPTGTYIITPLTNSLEVIENNMRVIKLATPVREGFIWNGNRYLASQPYSFLYNFSNDDNMGDWKFTYETTNDVFEYNQQKLTEVLKVIQNNERPSLDTVDVVNNKATIPDSSDAVWLRGTASDIIQLTAKKPSLGYERMMIYNQTGQPASLNNIIIPSKLALSFEFYDDKWTYTNSMKVINNRVFLQKDVSVAFIIGAPTDKINVDVTNVDFRKTKRVTIYNKTDKDAYANFNNAMNQISIPPGKGRVYEYYNNAWRLLDDKDEVIEKDPFITELPFGAATYGMEKYAKGIGMIFQELILWEYQNNPDGTPYKVGFGVKRSMIDHN